VVASSGNSGMQMIGWITPAGSTSIQPIWHGYRDPKMQGAPPRVSILFLRMRYPMVGEDK
ncbi:hypothetical protein, partial [Thiolapillus sp.]|uniref:hypothetical protein n=1 Tax=Thiolapillus sp. TaxID=2017437 RepID=UPI0025DADE49